MLLLSNFLHLINLDFTYKHQFIKTYCMQHIVEVPLYFNFFMLYLNLSKNNGMEFYSKTEESDKIRFKCFLLIY